MSTNPYTSVSISGYNSSPPPDDGSTGADNTLKWSFHKDKLADPVKTLAEAVNTNVLAAFGKTINTDSAEDNAHAGGISYTPATFTIATGAITPTRVNVVLAAESGTADTLDTMATASMSDGGVVILSVDTGDTITINDAEGSAGQIHLVDSVDFAMSGNDRLTLMRDGADWYELSRSIAPVSGTVIQTQFTQSSALATTTGNAVLDDSVPTTTECPINTALNTTITPKDASHLLIVEVMLTGSLDGTVSDAVLCIFEDAETDAKAATASNSGGTDGGLCMRLVWQRTAGGTSAITFKAGCGADDATDIYWNGIGAARFFGGVSVCSLRITEIAP